MHSKVSVESRILGIMHSMALILFSYILILGWKPEPHTC